eukprot:1727715-Amphidinium_carterae.1
MEKVTSHCDTVCTTENNQIGLGKHFDTHHSTTIDVSTIITNNVPWLDKRRTQLLGKQTTLEPGNERNERPNVLLVGVKTAWT